MTRKSRQWIDMDIVSGPVAPTPAIPPPPEEKRAVPPSADGGLKTTVSWWADEYPYVPKSGQWYWAVGIFTLTFLVVSVLIHNFLFAILMVLAGFTVALYGARRPRTTRFSVSARGVEIGSRLYPYELLESFWVRDDPHAKELDIVSKKILVPRITIPLGDADPAEVREILLPTSVSQRAAAQPTLAVGDPYGLILDYRRLGGMQQPLHFG